MLDKPLEQVSLADLHDLLNERFPEGKSLDYKRDMYGRGDSEKKELLKDVTSFANTTGGDLIIGMDEANGVPTSLMGVPVPDVEAEKLRLEEIIRRGTDPRIDFSIHTVETGTGTTVFVIRIKESWILPHRVVYQGQFGEFWARNSAGKYSMDTTELRRAFNLSETVYERVRGFRQERVRAIENGNAPIPLKAGARLVVHLVPLESLRSRVNLELNDVQDFSTRFPPLGHRHTKGWGPRHNFDGFLVSSKSDTAEGINSYVQIYRNGVIEAALDSIAHEHDGNAFLSAGFYERTLLSDLPKYLEGYRRLLVRTPIWAFLTLMGVKGATIRSGDHFMGSHDPIDRDVLQLPEIVIESFDQSIIDLLRPSFDLIWNAAGYPYSMSFDSQGRFRAQ